MYGFILNGIFIQLVSLSIHRLRRGMLVQSSDENLENAAIDYLLETQGS